MRGKIRVSSLELVLFLLVILIGWTAWYAFRTVQQIDQAPVVLEKVRSDYLEIAEHLQKFTDESHTSLEQTALQNSRPAWSRFEETCRSFRVWLDGKSDTVIRTKIIMVKPIGYTVDLGTMLNDVQVATAAYTTEAHRMITPSGIAADAKEIEESAEEKAKQLVRLSNQAYSQAGAIGLFSSGSRRWFGWVRRVIYACVLTLVVVATWLAVVVYRRAVVPLRRQLIATQAIVERQQKLAHFGELAAIVAHEIRNPLTAIRARLFTLERALAAGSAEHEDAVVIGSEINRLNRIVKDFLESARPSNPQMELMTAGPLLQRVHQLLEESCAKQSIVLELTTCVDQPFLGDVHQLQQVLINLVQNASDSIGQNGRIQLRAHDEQRRLRAGLVNVVIIEVEDNGPGIPEKVQRRLFDPFYSTKKGGTGLGLSIAARIVNRHGGTIEFVSEPGRSTIFGVVLPVHQANA